jgi:hypothetical protein
MWYNQEPLCYTEFIRAAKLNCVAERLMQKIHCQRPCPLDHQLAKTNTQVLIRTTSGLLLLMCCAIALGPTLPVMSTLRCWLAVLGTSFAYRSEFPCFPSSPQTIMSSPSLASTEKQGEIKVKGWWIVTDYFFFQENQKTVRLWKFPDSVLRVKLDWRRGKPVGDEEGGALRNELF